MRDIEDIPLPKRIKIDPEAIEDKSNENGGDNMEALDQKIECESVQRSINNFEENYEVSGSKYDYVTPEELQKLREFKVLDEVNEEDSKDEDSDSSGKSEDLPDEEIEKMLDEDLPEGFKGAPKPKEKPYVTREKIVLEEKGINHFEVLPLDWMMVRHCSGMPVYMHRGSRVCTLSKPYFLGKGNTRKHDIPISAIPCLSYRKALEEEEEQKKIDDIIAEQIKNGTWVNDDQTNKPDSKNSNEPAQNKDPEKSVASEENPSISTGESNLNVENDKDKVDGSSQASGSCEGQSSQNNEIPSCPFKKVNATSRKPVILPGGIVMPPPRVEEVNTSWKSQHLSYEEVNNYCKNLFKFKTVNIMHFKRWADRRRYTKARKALQYPALPDGTKLITIPAQPGAQDGAGRSTKRDWVMNMNGCSYLSVFHEYVRRALQKQPVYEFKQLENAAHPYQATVYIGGMQYGSGRGSSKRQAKSAAARASIHILIPEMKDDLEAQVERTVAQPDPDFSFFDYVGIEDPRVQEFSAAAAEPSPHAILRTCLLRNFGAGDRHIHTEMKKLEYQKIELTMKVGKHSATVVCKNKKQAKQTASQAILQALHPHIRSWGSLLRLYGSRSVKSCKERKLEEQQITLLQDKAQQNAPNYAVLRKLRDEMRRLRQRDAAVVPIGTLLLAHGLPTHSSSNLNNVDL